MSARGAPKTIRVEQYGRMADVDPASHAGAITPAISVPSAVDGLKVDAPWIAPAVLPIAIAMLVGLIAVQAHGSAQSGGCAGFEAIVITRQSAA